MNIAMPTFEEVESARLIASKLIETIREINWQLKPVKNSQWDFEKHGQVWKGKVAEPLSRFDELAKEWSGINKDQIGVAIRRCGLEEYEGKRFISIEYCKQMIQEVQQNFRALSPDGNTGMECWISFFSNSEVPLNEKREEAFITSIAFTGISQFFTDRVKDRVDAEFVGAADWCLENSELIRSRKRNWIVFKSMTQAAADDRVDLSRTRLYKALNDGESWIRKDKGSQVSIDIDDPIVK